MEVFKYIHREFSHKAAGERILTISPYLPMLLSNIKGYTFLGHSVDKKSTISAKVGWDLNVFLTMTGYFLIKHILPGTVHLLFT